MTNFASEVESIVGPLLTGLGFVLGEIQDFDEGGRPGTVVYYHSGDCKIQIYKSSRQGSINCIIAPLSAHNEFGLRNSSSEWQFISRFTPTPDVRFEELIKSVSYKSKPDIELLEEVREHGGIFFDTGDPTFAALAGGMDKLQEQAVVWPVNEQFLRTQMENQVGRIDYVLDHNVYDSLEHMAVDRAGTYSSYEVNFLNEVAGTYGYERVGDSWVYVGSKP